MNQRQEKNQLIDRFQRVVNYVRLSVTDRCDFRCVYCMSEEMSFLPRQQILSLEEIALIAEAFVQLGVAKFVLLVVNLWCEIMSCRCLINWG